MRPLTLFGAFVLCLVVVGCASTPSSSQSRDPDVITYAEVASSNQSNAYEMVRSRRPNWLNRRGAQSIHLSGGVVVYLDATRLGGAQMLRQIPLTDVRVIRYLDAITATQRWGTDHGSGVIQVETR